MSLIADFVAEATAPPPSEPVTPNAPDLPPRFPSVLTVDAPPPRQLYRPTLDESRATIKTELRDYLAQDAPAHMLLIRAAPGVGKTHIAVNVAEELAAAGKRVLYCGPRHDFFADILRISTRPELWYEWLPRQAGNDETGKPETCRYAVEIATWQARGYDAVSFCQQVCGWDYIKRCPYHVQKKRTEPCIFGQHQHVMAHPLKFHALLGDEDPVNAFMHEWLIGAKYIRPSGLDPADALTHILHSMTSLALTAKGLTGPKLLEALGGAAHVLEACETFKATPDSLALAPDLRHAKDAETADYFHLPALVNLLIREAKLCLTGQPYLHRIILNNERLILLLRKAPADRLPPHVIWLDATAEPHIYEAIFQRPVEVIDAQPRLTGRVIQVHNRSNNKRALLDAEGNAREQPLAQLQAQVDALAERHKNPALITYQSLTDALGRQKLPTLHFFAARGTNALIENDALIVAGTPAPALEDVSKAARMIYFERDAAFDVRWLSRPTPYAYTAPDGTGRAQMVGGYWADPDLNAVLWSKREAELIQAAHRIRPLTRDVPVYLLASLPLAELPPNELLSIQELLGAPDGVSSFDWQNVLWVANNLSAERGWVSVADLQQMLGISHNTARKYFAILLADTAHWETLIRTRGGPGRPAETIYRK